MMTHEERRMRRKRMAEKVANGTSVATVGRDEGVTQSTVSKACSQFGVELKARHHANRMRFSTFKVIADLIIGGHTLNELADLHRISYRTAIQISQRCKAAGIKVRIVPDKPGRKSTTHCGKGH